MADDKSLLEKLVYKLIKKHIAGVTAASAIRVAKQINKNGLRASLTFLNDSRYNSASPNFHYNYTSYLQLTKELFRLGINSDISLRLSQIGYPDKQGIDEMIPDMLNYLSSKNVLWIEYEDCYDIDSVINFASAIKDNKIGVEVPLDKFESKKLLKSIPLVKNIKIIPYESRKPADIMDTKPKKKTDLFTEYGNAVSKLKGLKVNIYIYMQDEKMVQKFINANRAIKRNLTFEIPLGYSNKKISMLLKNNINLCIYTAYGKDWIPYAINKLTSGRIKEIAVNLLDKKDKKVDYDDIKDLPIEKI
ncbi:proline dehydrogenase [Candidatus Mancarchaeum acidiphilum]|uniref:Proline dehydrogenase n=1 Tax=Candidatus Mancarchaeum acidiphilum TaxID=1920749 RepID=A0A218NMK1_9ARCH|nr:hypothetical protein [Candidatus Mancarchaeum acidiphilum]ASI13698.1 proline dehydrogenase [Candidatus Mancarchaeum acidiphilum]